MIKRLALLSILALLVSGVALTQQTIGQDSKPMSQKDMKAHKEHMSGDMKLSGDDKKFVMKVAEGGKTEVDLGNLALRQAGSDDVKQFAQRMVDDHSKAGGELAQLAQSKGLELPMADSTNAINPVDPDVARINASTTTPSKPAMDHSKMTNSDGHKLMHKLSTLSGADFDREYMKHMVEAHQKTVALFEKEVRSGKDADLKAWADKTLPTVKEHLQMAREVNGKVSGKSPQ